MTTGQTIQMIEEYYGAAYRGAVRVVVAGYLEQFTDGEREAIFTEVAKTFSNRFGQPPDLQVIAEAAKGAVDKPPRDGVHTDRHGNRKLYRDGLCVGHYDGSRLIPWLHPAPAPLPAPKPEPKRLIDPEPEMTAAERAAARQRFSDMAERLAAGKRP